MYVVKVVIIVHHKQTSRNSQTVHANYMPKQVGVCYLYLCTKSAAPKKGGWAYKHHGHIIHTVESGFEAHALISPQQGRWGLLSRMRLTNRK